MDNKEEKETMSSLKDIVYQILEDNVLPVNPDDARIWDVWEQEVDPALSMYARPLWIKDGILKVSVKHPIVLQELKFMEKDIKDRLNRKMGRDAVLSIRFSLATE